MTIRIELPLLEVVAVGNRRASRGKIIRDLRDGDRIDDYQAMSWIVSTLAPLINLSTDSTASIENARGCYNMQNNQCNPYVNNDVCKAHNWNANGVIIRRPNKRVITIKVITNRSSVADVARPEAKVVRLKVIDRARMDQRHLRNARPSTSRQCHACVGVAKK